MKIEDCQTLPEFFGVKVGGCIWVEGHEFTVRSLGLASDDLSYQDDARALVGCLSGQLEWSTEELCHMSVKETEILLEVAAWLPRSDNLLILDLNGTIKSTRDGRYGTAPFGCNTCGSKAYTVLAPILEKYGEINLDDYRDTEAEKEDESPFGSCDFCGYAFNSELINEYEITHCPKCGEEIEESVDLDW